MPTAKSAVYKQPSTRPEPRRRRFLTPIVGALVGLALLVPADAVTAPSVAARAGANNCGGWSSTTRPPDYIRVLRRQSAKVERVPFKKYVITVLGKEWPSYLPQPVVEAGAVAVKQYAWYHALGRGRQTSDGRCFDVRDGTGDQLYKPNRARVRQDHYRAVEATWGVRLLKRGQLFMTGYRRGSKGNCGRDATGWKLYARSATRCAYNGLGYREILRTYYSPDLEIIGGGSSGQSSPSTSQRPATTSATPKPTPKPTPSRSPTPTPTPTPTPKPTAPSSTAASPSSGTPRMIDDRSRQIAFRGSWQRIRASSALGDTLTYSGLAGSSATFRFVGKSLELIGRKGPHRGWIDIYVNGRRKDRVDLLAGRRQNRTTMFAWDWRRSKTRTIRIEVVGSADRPRVDLDAILVN